MKGDIFQDFNTRSPDYKTDSPLLRYLRMATMVGIMCATAGSPRKIKRTGHRCPILPLKLPFKLHENCSFLSAQQEHLNTKLESQWIFLGEEYFMHLGPQPIPLPGRGPINWSYACIYLGRRDPLFSLLAAWIGLPFLYTKHGLYYREVLEFVLRSEQLTM